MILCNHCGNQNKNEGSFCTFCGNRLPAEGNLVGRLILLGPSHREYLIADVERTIGREPSNDLVVDDEEVSGQHAKVSLRGSTFWVEDLGSRNGTFVNGTRIGQATALRNDDLLKIGSTLMKFQI